MAIRWNGVFEAEQFEENEPDWRGYKECSKCHRVLPKLNFCRSYNRKDLLSGRCRECFRDYDKGRRAARYGLTNAQLVEMINGQQGKCAICQRVVGIKLQIDHDHKTHKVRGLLCYNCNLGLGNFQDDLALMQAGMDYLKRTSGEGNGQAS